MLETSTFDQLKRSHLLRQLQSFGITEFNHLSIYELDYHKLKYVLTMAKIQNS